MAGIGTLTIRPSELRSLFSDKPPTHFSTRCMVLSESFCKPSYSGVHHCDTPLFARQLSCQGTHCRFSKATEVMAATATASGTLIFSCIIGESRMQATQHHSKVECNFSLESRACTTSIVSARRVPATGACSRRCPTCFTSCPTLTLSARSRIARATRRTSSGRSTGGARTCRDG